MNSHQPLSEGNEIPSSTFPSFEDRLTSDGKFLGTPYEDNEYGNDTFSVEPLREMQAYNGIVNLHVNSSKRLVSPVDCCEYLRISKIRSGKRSTEDDAIEKSRIERSESIERKELKSIKIISDKVLENLHNAFGEYSAFTERCKKLKESLFCFSDDSDSESDLGSDFYSESDSEFDFELDFLTDFDSDD